jgi:transcriptional regulator with XRE-family HTH domain
LGVAFLKKYPQYGGTMKLAEYLATHDLSYAEFARRIGVKSAETARRYATGERLPGKDLMARIAEATEFKVTANDFFGIAA